MANPAPISDGSADSRIAVEEARLRAAAAGRRVAVVFGADWCPDYRAFEAALESPYVAPFLEDAYEIVRVDVGQRNRNLELMAEYGMKVERGIPALAFLEADGALVTALRDGELAHARAMPIVEIADIFRRHRPPGLPGASS